MINKQIENFNNDIEAIKKEILKPKNTMNYLQNSTESFNVKVGEGSDKLKDRS